MPASLRKLLLSFLPASVLAIALLPIAIALFAAHAIGMQQQQDIVTLLAQQVLVRTDTISREMYATNNLLSTYKGTAPCSPERIRLMRIALLHSDNLSEVGQLENNRLICSAFGLQDYPMGEKDYTSSAGYDIRHGLRLTDANDITFIAVTDPRSNITMFVHDVQALTSIPQNEPWQAAVVGDGQGGDTLLSSKGKFEPSWRTRAFLTGSGTFVTDHHIVAWIHSQVGAYTVFVAMPEMLWRPALYRYMLWALVFSVPVSLLLALAFKRMSNRNTTLRYLLRQGIKHRELSLAYQPVVDLSSGHWVGAEALLRWKRPNGEIIPPDIFIPFAEKSGMMPTIREYIIGTLEREATTLFARHPSFHVALNFSAGDFRDFSFPDRLKTAVTNISAQPHNIQIEVTERVFMHTEDSSHCIDLLRSFGFTVAIDDFGTGFSSLSYLTRLKFDALKIDKSFVGTVDTGAMTSKVVDHIIELAKSLNISMIAEGVETQQQADYLLKQGVQYAQGWLYAKAMPMQELLTQLPNHRPN